MALPCEVVEALIRWRWVERDRADDKSAIERAVEAGLIDAARHLCCCSPQRARRANKGRVR